MRRLVAEAGLTSCDAYYCDSEGFTESLNQIERASHGLLQQVAGVLATISRR